MPIFANQAIQQPNRFNVGGPNGDDMSGVVNTLTTRADPGLLAATAGVIGLGAVDLVDTVASSVPGLSSLVGAERGDINEAMLTAVDMPGLRQFYNDYQSGIEATSAVAGIIGAELTARRLTRPAGALMQGLSKLPYARRIATLDGEYRQAMQTVRSVDMELARRGALGMEQYAGRVRITADGANDLGVAVDGGLDISRTAARSGALRLGALKGVRDVARTEAVMGVTLNQNGFLYDESAAQNLMWMGLGLGAGAGLEWLHGAYRIRRHVNSDEVRRTFAHALDPDGSEEARLLWRGMGSDLPKEEAESLFFAGGSFTDQITSLSISRKNLLDSPVTGEGATQLLANRDRLATQHLQLARETLNKVTTKGDGVNGFTAFDVNARGYGNHVDMLLNDDAGAFYLAEQIAAVPEEFSVTGLVRRRADRLTERITQMEERVSELMNLSQEKGLTKGQVAELDAAKNLIRRLSFFRDETVPVPYIDGEAATLSDAKAFDGWVEPTPAPPKKIDEETTLWEVVNEHPAAAVGIDSKLNIYLPLNATLDTADHFDMLRLYRQSQRAIQHFAKGKNPLQVPRNPNWFQLDMAEEVLRQNEHANVIFPDGMTRESAQVESFAQKAEAIKKQLRVYGGGKPSSKFDPESVLAQAKEPPKTYAKSKSGSKGWENGIRAALGLDIEEPALKSKTYSEAFKKGRHHGRELIPDENMPRTIKKNPNDPTTLRTNKVRTKAAPELTEEEIASRLRIKYNLPRLTAYERGIMGEVEHPVESLLRGASSWDGNIREMGLGKIKESVARYKRLGDIQPVSQKDVKSLYGSSFRFMLDGQGRPIKPLIMYKRPFQSHEWAKDRVEERMAARNMVTLNSLAAAQDAPVTSTAVKSFMANPDYDAAARTHELMETQIQGSFAGASPQSALGALAKSFTTREMQDRDSPILLAASRLQRSVSNHMRGELRKLSEAAFGDTLTVLDSPRNTESKLLLNQFHSFRKGWDVVTKPGGAMDMIVREGPQGKKLYAFMLDRTTENLDRFKQQFGKDMPPGQTLLAPNGREVVLDELALDVQNRFNVVTERLRKEQNALLKAQGLREISHIPMYVPSPNTSGKFIGHIYGPDGKILKGSAVIANTQAEFSRLEAEAMKRIEKDLGMGYTFRTQDDVKRFATIWDKAQMDMIDPGTTAVLGGKRATGAMAPNSIDTNAFESSLKNIQDRFLDHGNDIIETIMKEQINAAKGRANISSSVTRNRSGFFRDQQFRSVHHVYLENLLGKSPLSASGSLVGRIYNTIEGGLDQFLADRSGPMSRTWQGLNEWIGKLKPWDSSQQSRKDFEALRDKLADHMPFESAAEMAAARGAGSMPTSSMDLMAEINKFTTAMMLRMFEVVHPIMNLSGMVNAMPSVIRHIAPRKGESAKDFAARVGHSAHIFDLGNGKFTGTLDMGKIAMRGMNRAFNAKSHPDWEIMARHGYLQGNVAEILRDYSSMQTKRQWQVNMDRIVDKASVLTDKSEDFSRAWGHMVGLELADELGIRNREAAHAFAHDMANKMIANYSPHNRAEVFQGALGAPIGLFQSWIINYYQRMFRYIETKDMRALATQMAMQSSLFGVTTVPGWNEAQAAFMWATDGETDISDGVHQRYGSSLGSVLANGTLGNIPRLFGLDAADFSSRGGTEARLPGINPTAGFAAMTKIYQGMSQGIAAFSDANPELTSTQLAEIASNMIPNRPIAGIIEQLGAGGMDTDSFGQLVHDTQSHMESVYRMIGMRSQRQAREVEAFYANKSAMELKSSQDDILRTATRAAIRSENWDALPRIFEQYVMNGGDPRHFRRWLKINFEAATTSRAERQLREVINDPEKMRMVVRLLDAGVGITEDEQTESYESSLQVDSGFDTVSDPGIR